MFIYENPTKTRFIIALPECPAKPLSKALTAGLKLIYK